MGQIDRSDLVRYAGRPNRSDAVVIGVPDGVRALRRAAMAVVS